MLGATVPLGEGELPASFCSRLAFLNGCRSAQDFCEDMGLNFRDIVNGEPKALEELAGLGGVSAEALFSSAFRKVGDRYHIGMETMSQGTLRWSGLLMCPACLEEDSIRWKHIEDAALYFRTAWLVSGVKTCVRHNLKLIEVWDAKSKHRLDRYDTATLLVNVAVLSIADFFIPRRASLLEVYVVNRLGGVQGDNWLDEFPLYAALKACEFVGASAYRGHQVAFADLDDDAQYHAGAIGFQILSAGPASFRSFLRTYRRERGRATGDPGLKGMFGYLYTWLAHHTQDAAYEPLRTVMRDVALESMAVEEGAKIFGQPAGPRKVHSIYSAAQMTGVSRPTMRTFLREHGFIRDEDIKKTDDAVLVPVSNRLTRFLEDIASAMTLSEAADYLGTTRKQIELLVERNLVVPMNSNMVAHNRYSFAQQELDRFLGRLLADVPEVNPSEEGLVDITTAALRATCRSVDVVTLILDRRLPTIRFTRKADGFNSVLVRSEEVKEIRNRRFSDSRKTWSQ